MTVRYVAVCDGCGEERSHGAFHNWGQVNIREPNKAIEVQRSYDFCSEACVESWWVKVAESVSGVITKDEG